MERFKVSMRTYEQGIHPKFSTYIHGPWHEESGPRGSGSSKEESIREAVGELTQWQEGITTFLRENDDERQ